jgi:hypothetical protein
VEFGAAAGERGQASVKARKEMTSSHTLVLAFLLCLAAQADGDEATTWIIDASGCKSMGPGAPPKDAVVWTGQCRDDKADGSGTMVWPDGSHYEGEYRAGRRNGQGTLTYSNGDRYAGDWVDGLRQGHGSRSYWGGTRYDGEWQNDRPSGEGTMTWPGGWHYEGAFRNGRPLQPEKIKAADGSDIPAHRDNVVNEVSVASHIARKQIYNIAVPLDKPYEELNPLEKLTVKAAFPNLQEDDEPPYPLRGTRSIIGALDELNHRVGLSGTLLMSIVVGLDGLPKRVDMLTRANADTLKTISDLIMERRFKPGICHGEPCQMSYPFRMTFGTSR